MNSNYLKQRSLVSLSLLSLLINLIIIISCILLLNKSINFPPKGGKNHCEAKLLHGNRYVYIYCIRT